MKKYILIGSHGDSSTDRYHLKSLINGIHEAYDFVVKHSIKEAEECIDKLRNDGKKYFGIFNMNVLDHEEVYGSGLLKRLSAEKNAVLSFNHAYTHWTPPIKKKD